MSSTISPEFTSIEEALRNSGLLGEPAEIHGEYCGLACVMGSDAGPAWMATLLADAQGDTSSLRDMLQELVTGTREALESDAMEFRLLLPMDDESLESRAENLGLWCQGFLHGIGISGEPGDENPVLADDVTREIVADFSEITRAAFSDEEIEGEAETAYMELVEYVRVSVQIVYEELYRIRGVTNRTRHH